VSCYSASKCGRYSITKDKTTIEKHFGAKFYVAQPSFEWSPTFNAAPSQMLPIIRTYNATRIELASWGFWLEEWKRSTRARPMINARLCRQADVRKFIPRHTASPLPTATMNGAPSAKSNNRTASR